MGKMRYLDTKFWSDSYVSRLDPVEKLLFIYLITNERTNVAGIYELPIKYMSVETGIETSMLENIISRFQRDGKVLVYDGWVLLVNAIKHQNLGNSKIRTGIEKILEDVPKDIKDGFNISGDESSRVIDESLHLIKLNTIQLNNNTTEISDDVVSTETEKIRRDAEETFKELQRIFNQPHVRFDTYNERIKKLLRRKWSKEDILTAAEALAASPFHQGENDRKTVYANIAFLFGNSDEENLRRVAKWHEASQGGGAKKKDYGF